MPQSLELRQFATSRGEGFVVMLCQSDEDGFETMSMLLDQAVILQRVL